jgi:primary-amine oxidase
MLELSDLFEESYYLHVYPDVTIAVENNLIETALDHFIEYGQLEGRDPSPLFNTQYYLQHNPDVAAVVVDTAESQTPLKSQTPLTAIAHFLEFGQFEGRNPNPNFDTHYYLQKHPDVAAEVEENQITAFEHYLKFGQEQGLRTQPIFHPLDPLSPGEIQTAVALIKETQNLSDAALFPRVFLQEPGKSEVLGFELGAGMPQRTVFVSVLELQENKVYEAIVNLDDQQVVSWTEIPGAQPAILDTEFDILSEVVKADPRWQAAMIARGITNFDEVIIDGWAPGALTPEETASGARLIRGLSYLKGDDSNFYARPIEGVLATVNLNTQSVESLIDVGAAPIPDSVGFDAESIDEFRPQLPPLVIEQPEGVGFQIEGNQVNWDNWQFRYSIDPREGLVLHQVGYNDRGTLRPILYRAALSEMAVPYADTSETWTFRNAFDVGEYDLGKLTNSLEPGQTIPENSVLLDAVFADEFGEPYIAPGVVGVYERDSGLLWYHYDYVTDTTELRRGRELVMSFLVTIGNYDYGLDWIFKQDGSIEVQANLTGNLLDRGTAATTEDELGSGENSGTLVAPNILAPSHQHFFNFRLDFDVDGTANSAIETNTVSVPLSPGNPAGNAFIAQETLLTTETEAQRDFDLSQNREWTIINSSQTNALGSDIGYALEVEGNAVPYAAPTSSIRQRAGFVNHHLWVTQYNPNELYAGGDYPNQSTAGQGVVEYSSDNASIVGQDVVLWYTLGLTHHPRPEDFPILSVEQAGFEIVPEGFFTQNPTLDVPPPGSI